MYFLQIQVLDMWGKNPNKLARQFEGEGRLET